jgi:hypothetical protein
MFSPLLSPFRNWQKLVQKTKGWLHQEPGKDPVKRLNTLCIHVFLETEDYEVGHLTCVFILQSDKDGNTHAQSLLLLSFYLITMSQEFSLSFSVVKH